MSSKFGCAAATSALMLAASSIFAQTSRPPVPESGISDIGSFEQVPYKLEPQLMLKAEDKLVLRKLEDRHIQELRTLEDRMDKELRTLRAKQQAEREAMLKSFVRR